VLRFGESPESRATLPSFPVAGLFTAAGLFVLRLLLEAVFIAPLSHLSFLHRLKICSTHRNNSPSRMVLAFSRLPVMPPLVLFKFFQQPTLLPANVMSLFVENLSDAVENNALAKLSARFDPRQCGEGNAHCLCEIVLRQIH
jgi:hypothetical protein